MAYDNQVIRTWLKKVISSFVWCMWRDVWKTGCMLSGLTINKKTVSAANHITSLPVSRGWLFKLCVCQKPATTRFTNDQWQCLISLLVIQILIGGLVIPMYMYVINYYWNLTLSENEVEVWGEILLVISINLLTSYHECLSLTDYAIHYLLL